METINELGEAVKQVMLVANKLGNEVNAEVQTNAPRIIYQRFCSELVEVAKQNQHKTPEEIPRAMKILDAIDILIDFYPELKTL